MLSRRLISARQVTAALLIAALAAGLVGCGNAELTERYRAERMSWQVKTLERAMSENAEIATDEMIARVMDGHREIIDGFPPPDVIDETTDPAVVDVARISAASRLALSSMLVARATPETAEESVGESVELLESVRDGYSFDRNLAVDAGLRLASVRELTGDFSGAIDEMGDVLDRWGPAMDADGNVPDVRILRLPLRRASSYAVRGMGEQATRVFVEASETYTTWAETWSGTRTGEAALRMNADTYSAQGRWLEAVAIYEELDEAYGSDDNRASIWLSLAEIHASRLGDKETSRAYYERVSGLYGETTSGATADVALALMDIADDRHEAARARLTSVIDRFGDEEAIAATAKQHRAASYELEGRWDSAVAEYSALAAEFPTTMYGLAAPLRIVDMYGEIGETAAGMTALDEAAQVYQRVIRDYGGTPAEMAARNYMIETRLRQESWSDAASLLSETAAQYPDAQAAASMLIQAADIYREELDRPDLAGELLQAVVERYPGHDAAARAREILESLTE